jgi:hypothetical protein
MLVVIHGSRKTLDSAQAPTLLFAFLAGTTTFLALTAFLLLFSASFTIEVAE